MRFVLFLCLAGVLVFASLVHAGPEPVLYYSFENIEGDTVIDDSGNGNDGTIVDAQESDGKEGKGLELSANNRVAIEASDSLDPNLFQGNFTLAMWIEPTRAGNSAQQLWRSRKDDNHSTLFLFNDGTLSWRGDVNSEWTTLAESPDADPPAGEWSHIAVTGDMEKFRVYVDAEEVVNGDWLEMDGENDMYYLGWGTASAGESYAGKYDEVAIWRETLSRKDLTDLMLSGVPDFVAVAAAGKLTITWGTLRIQ
ncbi:LamG domain-containing protein [Candidatus Poribacteria bacterium]